VHGDREKWDGEWSGPRGDQLRPLNEFVGRALGEICEIGAGKRGRALDLASGMGRYALSLAAAGWECSAWDVSPVALARLEELAAERGLSIDTHAVDLLPFEAPGCGEPFDLVLISNFFDRDLWNSLHQLVSPGGHLIAVAFSKRWPQARPPMHCRLEPFELAGGLQGFETLLYDERGGRVGLLGERRA
jgi:tellurite methyltransferase